MGKLGPCKTFRGSLIVDQEESGGYKPAQTWARTTNAKTEHMPAGKNLPHASWRRFKTPLLALCILRRITKPSHVKKWQTSLTADKFSSTNQVIIINDLDNALFFYLKFVQVNLDSCHWCDQKKNVIHSAAFVAVVALTRIPGSFVIARSVLWSVLPERTGVPPSKMRRASVRPRVCLCAIVVRCWLRLPRYAAFDLSCPCCLISIVSAQCVPKQTLSYQWSHLWISFPDRVESTLSSFSMWWPSLTWWCSVLSATHNCNGVFCLGQHRLIGFAMPSHNSVENSVESAYCGWF